jgi:hypothetical protein
MEVKNLTLKNRRLRRRVYENQSRDLAGVLTDVVSNNEAAIGVSHKDERALNSRRG